MRSSYGLNLLMSFVLLGVFILGIIILSIAHYSGLKRRAERKRASTAGNLDDGEGPRLQRVGYHALTCGCAVCAEAQVSRAELRKAIKIFEMALVKELERPPSPVAVVADGNP